MTRGRLNPGRRQVPPYLLLLTSQGFGTHRLDVCVDRRSGTLPDLLREGAAFAVNVLSAGQEALSRRFAAGDESDKFPGVVHREGATGAPILDGVLARIECRVRDVLPGGDHIIVVGEVADLAAYGDGDPLLFYRGSYGTLEGDAPGKNGPPSRVDTEGGTKQ